MVLELKPAEANRLDDILSNEWKGERPYLARPDKVKITAKQVMWAKGLLRVKVPIVAIQNFTKLSEYHVRGVRRGRYDFLLDTHHTPHSVPPRQ